MYKVTKPKPWITVAAIPLADIKMVDVMLGKEPVERPVDAHKRLTVKPAIMINAVMYNMKDGKTCTNFVDEGKRVSYGFSNFGLVTQADGTIDFMDFSKVKTCKDFAGGGPSLIKDGKVDIDGDYGAGFTGDNPRSAIGMSDTTLFVVAIDGRQTVAGIKYEGMTLLEEAMFMMSLGCKKAINFDGGGSTHLLENGKVINTPCEDRAVDNMLCVYLKEEVKTMSNHRVYISASTQKENVGVGAYGTEQDRMMLLADRVKYWLETQKGKFTVFRNKPNWTLAQTVNDCNNLACELFIDNHSNAGAIDKTAGDGGAEGTEVFYYHQGGTTSNSYKIASTLYKYIAPLSPGKDRGILPDNAYVGSLYVIQQTNPAASLIEHIFHTNTVEVADMIANVDKYAKAEAKAICEYFGETWVEVLTPEQTVALLVKEMIKDGIVTDEAYWNDVLNGKSAPKAEYLQIAFGKATSKIQ